jgi:hypothetical protein
MHHTISDYSSKYRQTSVYGNIDSAEIAARLKSCDTHDRRGLILWMDDFEGAEKHWTDVVNGVGGVVALSTDYARSGDQSMKCTTGGAAGNYAGVRRYLVYPKLSRLGFEISFTYNLNINYYALNADTFDGATTHRGWIRIDLTNDRLRYYDDAMNFQTFFNHCPLCDQIGAFNTAKLVIDPVGGYYTRFILNDVEYDLSSYPLYAGASVLHPFYYYSFIGYTNIATNETFYVDDGIMTVDE